MFDGTYYHTAPWWANAWWQWQSLGTTATASLLVCLVLAPFVLRPALAVLLVGATATLAVLMSFRLGWSLPHYYYAWQPPLILACALVLYTLVRRGGGARLAAAALGVPLVVAAAGTVYDVARLEPRDYAVVEGEFGDALRRGTVAAQATAEMRAQVPGARLVTDPVSVADLSAVIADPTAGRHRGDPITTFVRTYRTQLVLHKVDFLDVYVTRSPAERPGASRRYRSPGARHCREPHAGRTAASIEHCLARTGLEVSHVPASGSEKALIRPSSGTGVKLHAPLSGGSQAIVVVEESVAAASQAIKNLRELLVSHRRPRRACRLDGGGWVPAASQPKRSPARGSLHLVALGPRAGSPRAGTSGTCPPRRGARRPAGP